MTTPDEERRLRELLSVGLQRPAPPRDHLWERSHRHLRRAQALRAATVVVGTVALLAGVALGVPRLLPREPADVILDSPAPHRTPAPEPPKALELPGSPPPDSGLEPSSPEPSVTVINPPSATATTTEPTCLSQEPVPDSAQRQPVEDVDGDGAADELVYDGGRLSLRTAQGATSGLDLNVAGPNVVVGVADATGEGTAELFVGTRGRAGRAWRIARFDGCALGFVQNIQGRDYTFDVGTLDGVRHGLGCVDVNRDGDLELVGTAATVEGDTFVVQRTVVDLQGNQARNGAIDQVRIEASNEAAVATLDSATCGVDLLDDATFP